MTTSALTKTKFEQELKTLERLQQHVGSLLKPAVEAYLDFASQYRDLVLRVDAAQRDVARARLGIDNYQHQRFMAIADSSGTLRPISHALPPAIEPLYEVARIAKKDDGKKRLRVAVDAKRLTRDSGIREIRLIRTGRKRAKPSAGGSQAIRIAISLADEVRVARVLASLLEDDQNTVVESDSQSLVEATKDALARRQDARRVSGDRAPGLPDAGWNVVSAHEQLAKGVKVSGTRADDVVKNTKHPFHSPKLPNPDVAGALLRFAEEQRWVVPELGLTIEHYAPELVQRQQRIRKR